MMSNEKSGSDEKKSQKKRSGRRRPVKRRRSSKSSKENKKSRSQKQDGSSNEKQRINERARNERRRRRKRRSSNRRGAEKPTEIKALEIDYVAPESVFIYTHVARKDQRDAAYEYRPDHFAHTGRQLADFRIDLSPIMGTILEVEDGSRGILNEFVWDNDLDEETVYEEPETPASADAQEMNEGDSAA
jgi:hypothetical protein